MLKINVKVQAKHHCKNRSHKEKKNLLMMENSKLDCSKTSIVLGLEWQQKQTLNKAEQRVYFCF